MKIQETRGRFRSSASAAAIAAVLSLTTVSASMWTTQAVAQVTTSTLQGRVNGAGAGVTVTATDANTGVSINGATRADGSFTIVGLRPGNYSVKAGSTPAQDITLAVGDTAYIELGDTPSASADQGTVTVVGRRSRNVRTSEISTNVSPAQMENLPQNDRNFLNFAALAPGVSVSTGNKTFQAGGVGPDQVNVFIDGQSYKNQTSHGGVAGQSFTPGNPFPQLAVQEFKISSQNFKAEFEQSGAAIITAVTKSGGTEFHGTLFGELTDKSMYGRPYFDRPGNANNPTGANAKPDYKRYQYGFDFGGPIIRNKLHFYVAGEFNDTTRPTTSVNLQAPVPQSVRDAENGSFATPFKQELLFGKLTYYVNDADTLNFSYFSRKEDNIIDFGDRRTQSLARNVRADTVSGLFEWAHRGNGYLNEMSLAYQDSKIGTPTVTEGPRLLLTDGLTGAELAFMGAQEFEQDSGQKLWTFKNDITFTSFDWNGSHVVKAGFKYSKTTLSRLEANQANGTYFYAAQTYNGTATDPGSSQMWKATLNLLPPTVFEADNDQIGLYVQDDWTLDDHWTINLGVRWDYESNMMNNKFVTPQPVVDALKNYQGWQAAGIDYRDYVSTGSNRKAFTGAIAPRLGISYDVYGDRSLVFFAGAGRYYDRNVFLSGQIESVKNLASRIVTKEFCGAPGLPGCADNTGPGGAGGPDGNEDSGRIAWNPAFANDPNAVRSAFAATGTGGEVWLLNNKTDVPFSDNMNIGVRKRLGEINLSVSVAHNKSYNIFQYVRGNRLPDGTFTPLGDGWVVDNFPTTGPYAGGILPGFSGKLNIGASEGKSKYNALFVTVEKPYSTQSHYGYTATLTLADAKANGSELGSDEFFAGARQNVFGYNHAMGVDKLRFVGSGIVDGPWDTRISALLTLASGQPYGFVDFSQTKPFNEACCIANLGGANFPEDDLAYQQLDVRISKDFELPNGNVITVDGQVYNLFDHVNRVYSSWGGRENNTQGPARTYQVGLKYKW